MTSARNTIITSIIIFTVAIIRIAILGALPPVEGSLSDEGAQIRVEIAEVFVLAATLLGAVSLFVIAKLGSMR